MLTRISITDQGLDFEMIILNIGVKTIHFNLVLYYYIQILHIVTTGTLFFFYPADLSGESVVPLFEINVVGCLYIGGVEIQIEI